MGPQLITALPEGSSSHRPRRIEQDWDSQKRRAENKDVSRESQASPAAGCAGLNSAVTRRSPPLKIKKLSCESQMSLATGCAGINQAVTRNNFALKLSNLAASHRRVWPPAAPESTRL